MRHRGLFGLGMVLWASAAAPVAASSDYIQGSPWTLTNRNLTPGSNLAVLQPGNDTRVNLMLLLQDNRRGDPRSAQGGLYFEWGELSEALYPASVKSEAASLHSHSRCQTVETGRDAFVQAVRARKGLPATERDLLISFRQTMAPDCDDSETGSDAIAQLAVVQTTSGQDFAVYLRSALAFYNSDFVAATKGFSSLVKARDHWVKETALYMIARSELNRSLSEAFDQYGYFETPSAGNQGAIENARRGFNLYLKIYPQGAYQQSAKGLLRRAYWLGGDVEKLSREYAAVLADPAITGSSLPTLIQEVDDKFLSTLLKKSDSEDPALLAMIALYRMRDHGGGGDRKGSLTRSELEAMRDTLDRRPGLFDYLLASHAFYVENDPKSVLQLIADDARKPSYGYLGFSRQVLRGRALEAVGDRNARGFWQQLVSGSDRFYQRALVELALAMNLERGGAVDQAFAADSAVTTPVLREVLLQYSAGPDLLRKQANDSEADRRERDLALYVLLYQQLTHGAYSGFLDDLKQAPSDAAADGPFYNSRTEIDYGFGDEPSPVPVGIFTKFDETGDFGCPLLKQTVTMLASDPQNVRGQLCLAEYMRLAGFDDYWLDRRLDSDRLGGGRPGFAGPEYSRLTVYQKIIADRSASPENRAYALYRAVWCYGPAGINSCGGGGVDVSQRGAWFKELKNRYPASRWAQNLKYYW